MSTKQIILITGGARSGKSRFALELASHHPDKLFVATCEPLDAEMQLRISKHVTSKGQRPRLVNFDRGCVWGELPHVRTSKYATAKQRFTSNASFRNSASAEAGKTCSARLRNSAGFSLLGTHIRITRTEVPVLTGSRSEGYNGVAVAAFASSNYSCRFSKFEAQRFFNPPSNVRYRAQHFCVRLSGGNASLVYMQVERSARKHSTRSFFSPWRGWIRCF